MTSTDHAEAAGTPTRATATIAVDRFALTGVETGLDPSMLLAQDRSWVPAVVPGGVHESLLAAGLIEHPYRDQHEGDVRWIEERDWWYRTTLTTPDDLAADERLLVTFHGLDTVVDIWLNGRLLGHHENMFRPAEFDITDLTEGSDELMLRFTPPLAGLQPSQPAVDQLRKVGELLGTLGEGDEDDLGAPSPELTVAAQRRKATFSWGWDFGPRVPSVGIWRPVELVRVHRARITGHHVRTDAVDVAAGTADLTITVEAEAVDAETELTAQVLLTAPDGAEHRCLVELHDGVGRTTLRLNDAQFWWTHDLGVPALYDVEVTLTESGQVRDVARDRVGVRTVRLDRPEAEGGRLFRFLLNGVETFARGANWLPASMLVGSVTPERYRALVQLARDGGMTMLRVWAGGIYEDDAFYAATDELGVLVWQDFAFACADYPSENPTFANEVALEAAYQVRRLRNRASLALWCGNNEVHVLHGFAYQRYEPGNWGWSIFHQILPAAVHDHDPTTPYWPGSPWGEHTSEGFMAVNGVLDGDRHAWEVWHGFDAGAGGGEYASPGLARHFSRYANDTGRFISEFGVHAAPVLPTLQRWISPSELALHSETLDAHNKDHPKDKGDALLEIITGLPETLEEYIDFTMVSQAEALRFGIEHYRRRQPLCGGTLIWQLNDVWPGFSWSIIDHDTVPKAGYYASSRAFQPVIASFRFDDGHLELWISNSGRFGVQTTATVSVEDFAGGTVLRHEVLVAVAPGESRPVWSQPIDPSADQFAWVESTENVFPPNRRFFAEIKDLPLPPTSLRHRVLPTSATTATVVLEADAFAYLVRVSTDSPDVRISDNYLDLRAGDRRELSVTGLPEGFTADDLRIGSYIASGRATH